MQDIFGLVRQFNEEIIGLPTPDEPTSLFGGRLSYAVGHLREEVDELVRAESIEDQVDALVDLIYVAAGRIIEIGVDPTAHFLEVHRANMRRVRGQKSTRPDSLGFDAVKPPGWRGPDHRAVMRRGRAAASWTNGLRRYKLLVLGYARHGKDSVCELLRDRYGFRFTSSSRFAARRIIMPYLEARYGEQAIFQKPDVPVYVSADEAYEDRGNHRELWYRLISDYCYHDGARLAREILRDNDVYCGMRNIEEFRAAQAEGLFDRVVWVDASDRVPSEGPGSCTVHRGLADFVLDNNGPVEVLPDRVHGLVRWLCAQ